jgi:hypothetical protein
MADLAALLKNSPMASRAWRLRNLHTIVDDQSRLVPFVPNDGQRQFYKDLHYCNHVLKARKLGFSTFIGLLNLDDCLLGENIVAGIVDKGMDDAKKKLRMMRTSYENLDNEEIHGPQIAEIGAKLKQAIPLVTDAKEELEWANGCIAYCGTSLRGGTTNRLHISELGAIAMKFPAKAQEIIEGALNSFTPGNRADIESTHEGGRKGIHYNLLRKAMAMRPEQLTPVDFRFHFYPWWQDPRYVLNDGFALKPHTLDYFTKLARDTRQTFSHGQMLWYERKADVQGFGMKKEFPSTPGEAFEAITNGAIYGTEMANLRAAGRVRPIGAEAQYPLFSFWDLGLSDYGVMWLIQPVGRAFLVLDWFECEGKSAAAFADQVRRWEAKWGRPIARHYLPHDANTRDRGTGKSYVACLGEAGISNVSVVPRTPDTWIGIGYVRDVLPHCWFDEGNCDSPRNRDGGLYAVGSSQEEYPSGIACLEGYARDVNPGVLREMPKHDQFSHSSDAFRTFAEAWRLGMVQTSDAQHRPPEVKNGPRSRR